jgi:hypothetical protein
MPEIHAGLGPAFYQIASGLGNRESPADSRARMGDIGKIKERTSFLKKRSKKLSCLSGLELSGRLPARTGLQAYFFGQELF